MPRQRGRLGAKDRRQKRASVVRRDGELCWWCKERPGLTLDHVVPVSAGGSHRVQNLRLACEECNQDRGGIHGPGSPTPGEPCRPRRAS